MHGQFVMEFGITVPEQVANQLNVHVYRGRRKEGPVHMQFRL
jgi:hypothetical protein